METAQAKLNNVKISEVIKDKPFCFTVGEKAPIRYVLEQLSIRNFLSVPVQSSENGQFIGIVSMMDILSFVVGFVIDKKLSEEEMDQRALEKLDREITCCLGLTEEGQRLWEFSEEDPLLKVMEAFHKGVHRVIVTVKGHNGVKFLSQTDVAKYLHANADQYGSEIDKSLSETHVFDPSRKVYTISYEKTAYDAFALMMIKGVSALPVVDQNNTILGHISASDLRKFEPMQLKNLLLPIPAFFKVLHRKHDNVITCKKDHSIRHALITLVDCGIHTLWVVDEHHNKVISVVTLSDIISIFSPL